MHISVEQQTKADMLGKIQAEEAPLVFAFYSELQNSVQASKRQDFTKVLKHVFHLNRNINKKQAETARIRQKGFSPQNTYSILLTIKQSIMFKPCLICLGELTLGWLQEKQICKMCFHPQLVFPEQLNRLQIRTKWVMC